MIVGAALAGPAAAQRRNQQDPTAEHDRCIALARSNPQQGLDRAKLWKDQGGGFLADHCIAMSLFSLKDYRGAGQRFEELATAMMQMPAAQRAQVLDQGGQAWLDAGDPARAKADFDAAIALAGEEPDLLIDRSEALAAAKQYWEAIDDLNRVIELAPQRADAYIYRGSAYRFVEAFDLALDDIEHALQLDPNAVLGLLERGNLRRLKGDVAGARKDWLRVEQLAPNTPAAAAAKVNIDRLTATGADKPQSVVRKKPPPQ